MSQNFREGVGAAPFSLWGAGAFRAFFGRSNYLGGILTFGKPPANGLLSAVAIGFPWPRQASGTVLYGPGSVKVKVKAHMSRRIGKPAWEHSKAYHQFAAQARLGLPSARLTCCLQTFDWIQAAQHPPQLISARSQRHFDWPMRD